jgi:photosystem II stability/assembly factor-like uncharacterized protein
MKKSDKPGTKNTRAKKDTKRTKRTNGKVYRQPERAVELLLSQRSSSFDWRRRWFTLSRSADEKALIEARDLAFIHKLRLIEEEGRDSGALAGYDPAGAGSPWFPIGPRNVNGRVKALAVHPTNPDIVYAGAASGGVWKSVDGGQTWDPQWDMQESLAVGAIGIAASSPQTVYAGTGEWTPGWGPSYPGAGVYVSTNGGGTWSLRNSCLCRRIGKLIVDPGNPLRVWICGDSGLERTDDGGTTWTHLRADTVSDIVLDPASASTLFIGVAGNGFFKSTDSGATFTLLAGSPTGAGVTFPQIAIGTSGTHGHNFLVIKMGGTVATSINGGTTFTTVSTGHGGYFGWCDVIGCAPDDETIIFYGGVGLERSTDGGTTWSGLPVHSDQHAATFAPSNSNIIYFANDGGVWRSDNKGAGVRKVSNGLVITQFYNIGFWRTLSNVIGGGAQDNATNYTTSGLTWRPVWTNDGGWFVIDFSDPRTMYAEGQGAYVAKSTDGGATWTAVTSGISGSANWEGILTMDPNDHLRLYYGTSVVLRTLDGCSTAWTTVSQTLVGEVSAIAVAASNSNRVYAGTTGGHVYRSDDGGNTSPWADKSTGLPSRPVSSIWVDPANADNILISVGGLLSTGGPGSPAAQSVYHSTNGGTSWTNVSGDLPTITANAVVGDPSSATTYYLATDGGVYRTTDSGTHWLPFDNGIPNVPVADLAVDPTLKMLYAGTFGRGAYKLDITPGITKPQVDLYLRDDDLDTGEHLPSPSGLPDPLVPAPALAQWWMSPDIKVNHAPFFTPSGTVFDGVDFDISLVHQDPHRTETNRFYLQVHNRGWQSTSNVWVRAFVADASAGLPPLPNALVPPNFNLSSAAVWTPVGPAQMIPQLVPNRPVIVTWDFNLPASTATHTCCLAVVSSADDPFTNTATDIGTLVTGDKRACLKNLHVIDPGPAPAGMTMVGIDFNNGGKRRAVAEIIIRPSLFDRGMIGLLLPKLEFAKTKSESVGVERIPLSPDDPIAKWYLRGKNANEKQLSARWEGLDRSYLWRFSSTQVSRLAGIRLDPGQTLRGALVCSHKRDVPTPVAPRISIEQRIDGVSIGGSTFQIGYDGAGSPTAPRVRRIRIVADHLQFGEKERDQERTMLWAQVTIAANPDRIVLRPLGDLMRAGAIAPCLFDGYLADGESLMLELMEAERLEVSEQRERLDTHHFEGPIDGWLGSHKSTRARDGFRFQFTIEDMTEPHLVGAD